MGYWKMCFRKIRKKIAFQEITKLWKILENKEKKILSKISSIGKNLIFLIFQDFP